MGKAHGEEEPKNVAGVGGYTPILERAVGCMVANYPTKFKGFF